MVIHARAPICLFELGGWTDTAFAEHGAVFSCTAASSAHVSLSLQRGTELRINAAERPTPDLRAYCHAAARYFGLAGLVVHISSDLPSPHGVDAFPAFTVALAGAMALLAEKPYAPRQLAVIAHGLVCEDLQCPYGIQRFMAAAHGGIGLYDITPFPRALATPTNLTHTEISALEQRLLLICTEQRSPRDVYRDVERRCAEDDPLAMNVLWRLRALPRKALEAAAVLDFYTLGAYMCEQTQLQRRLCPDLLSSQVLHLESMAFRHQALGIAVNGTGSLVALCRPEERATLAAALHQDGYLAMPMQIDRYGLRVWRQDPKNRRAPRPRLLSLRAA